MARKISGSGSSRSARTAKSARDSKGDFRPSKEDILKYIAENPDRAGKREIAKAFSLKGDDRIWLKDMLRDLQDEGLLTKERKRLSRLGALPHVTVLEIYARDADGGLLARPSEWNTSGFGEPPVVSLRPARNGPAPGIGDRVLAKTFAADEDGGPAYTGRVMKVLERRAEAVLGVVRQIADGSFRIEPVERRQPELTIAADDLNGAQKGDLVEVEQVSSARYGLPRGRVLQRLGSLTSEKAVSMIAIHAHEIPHIFPQEVLEEAESVKPATMAGREDFRDLPLITIDPADAKDHDDAVHAEPDTDEKNPGGVIVTVAIADVAAYVRPGSALDREALKRGNSVYFPDRVVPMLPERISNDLCSLRQGVDRPAMSVRMTFTAEGRKIRHSFHRIMMKSAARLAYPQAQAAIDGASDDVTGPILDTVLRPLWDAYAILKRGRESRHPLELDLPERKILLKPDGTVDRVIVPDRLDAHKLIEEFMIQANVAAAETLEAKRQALVYRVHDAPTLAKQESLREFLATLGISLARGAELSPRQFNGILSQVEGAENQALVNEVVLRTQSQAIYSPENLGHFGLNLRRYAHFTSPIRRYADLIVHRALISVLKLGADGITPSQEERLEEISGLISATERRAMAAERETVDRLIAAFLSEQIDQTFEARISGVTKAGLFVQLPQYGADGFVPISSLGDDYYHFDEAARALFGSQTGKGYQLADRVEVKLVEVAPLAGAMRFEMLSEPKPLPGSKRSFHKSKSGKRVRERASQPGRRRRR
ncbi:MAG: ribonuclease R [Rhizobiaceae bacterium]|nr:ribonuclease R [Rhizobiaceae bacterium]